MASRCGYPADAKENHHQYWTPSVYTLDFDLTASDGQARAGVVRTRRNEIPTPIFMPVGTLASVKALSQHDLKQANAPIILCNTYHMLVRSDPKLIQDLGGLHRFMSWDRSILTDSGGFQVFSLSGLNNINEHGVEFQSHHDGTRYLLTPESSIQIQHQLGADIIMAFDECAPHPCSLENQIAAADRTLRWAVRSREEHRRQVEQKPGAAPPALFGIVQGGTTNWLRREQAQMLSLLDFPGYAIGGLSVGESKELMMEALDVTTPLLPVDRPRYLMGVGYPEDLVEAVSRGIDMFDCVLPTRNGRKGYVFTRHGRLILKGSRFTSDTRPIEEDCTCAACQNYSRAYIRHLIRTGEILGMQLCSLHNITFYLRLMRDMRQAILENRFQSWKRDFLRNYSTVESA